MLGRLFSTATQVWTFHVWSWCALHRAQTSADPYAQVNTYYRKKREKAIARSLAALCLVAFRPSIQEWNDKSDNLTMLRLLVMTNFFLYHWKALEALLCSCTTLSYNQWKSWAMSCSNFRKKLLFGDTCWNDQKYSVVASSCSSVFTLADTWLHCLPNQCTAFSSYSLSRIKLFRST